MDAGIKVKLEGPSKGPCFVFKPTFDTTSGISKIPILRVKIPKFRVKLHRHSATTRPGVMESFSAMFPQPRQAALRALASREDDVAGVRAPTLVIHGRDDRVIPIEVSKRLFELLPNAELHLFRNCGHWTQIEKAARFNAIVGDFMS